MTGSTIRERPPRDPRLDFFRGVGMFIILIAHIPNNPWTLWIPARFGFSDATEMFVFCSGAASAIAFGGVFARAGWALGTLRILHRVWQVYWAHLGVFFVTLCALLVVNATGWFPRDYVGQLNLYPFLRDPAANLPGLMTLTYVPNYFDILPMYLVVLGMIPVAMALARISPVLPVLASLVLWLYATTGGVNLPAELWFANGSDRVWFFNPFAWQLVFFTGFAFMAGWLPAPPVHRGLVVVALGVVILSVPPAWYVTINASQTIRDWRDNWLVLFDKTGFGILRYVHFLALAYLAWVAVGPGGVRLTRGRAIRAVVAGVSRVGRQSLAVFMTSMVLAQLLGVALDVAGRGALATLAVNLAGFAMISGVALLVGWIKGEPWRSAGPVAAAAPASAPLHGVRT